MDTWFLLSRGITRCVDYALSCLQFSLRSAMTRYKSMIGYGKLHSNCETRDTFEMGLVRRRMIRAFESSLAPRLCVSLEILQQGDLGGAGDVSLIGVNVHILGHLPFPLLIIQNMGSFVSSLRQVTFGIRTVNDPRKIPPSRKQSMSRHAERPGH